MFTSLVPLQWQHRISIETSAEQSHLPQYPLSIMDPNNFVNQSGEPARDPRSQAGGRLGAASNQRDRGGDRMGWMALQWDDATMGRGLDGARGRTDGGQRTGMKNRGRGVSGLAVE